MEQTQTGYVFVKNVGPSPVSLHLKQRIDLISLGSILGIGERPPVHPSQIPFIIDQMGPGEEIVIFPGHTVAFREEGLISGTEVPGLHRLIEAGMLEIVDPRTIDPNDPLARGIPSAESPDFTPDMSAYAKLQGRGWWKSNYRAHPEWFEWMTDEQRADASNPSLSPVTEIFIRCPHCDKLIPKSEGSLDSVHPEAISETFSSPSVAERTPQVPTVHHRNPPKPIVSAYRRMDLRKDIVTSRPLSPPDPNMGDRGWMSDKMLAGLVDRIPDIIEKAQARIDERKRATIPEPRPQGHADDGHIDNHDVPSQMVSISKEKLGEVVADVLKQVLDRLT